MFGENPVLDKALPIGIIATWYFSLSLPNIFHSCLPSFYFISNERKNKEINPNLNTQHLINLWIKLNSIVLSCLFFRIQYPSNIRMKDLKHLRLWSRWLKPIFTSSMISLKVYYSIFYFPFVVLILFLWISKNIFVNHYVLCLLCSWAW